MKNLFELAVDFDENLFLQIFQTTGRKYIDLFFRWISHSADGYLYFPLLIFILLFDSTNGSVIFYSSLIAFALELPLYKIIKNTVKRSRPFEKINGIRFLIVPPDQFSFPSGHTAAAFIMATIIGSFHPEMQILLWSWASLVGFSRIYLGVHFPSDIIMGFFLGIGCAASGIYLV